MFVVSTPELPPNLWMFQNGRLHRESSYCSSVTCSTALADLWPSLLEQRQVAGRSGLSPANRQMLADMHYRMFNSRL